MPYPAQESYRPHHSGHHQSSRRSRRSSHFRLLELPVELRLLIIEFSLPAVNDVSLHWPAPIPALLRTSKQFHADTRHVMKNWSPMHYVPDTTYLHSIPHPGAVRVESVCLSMFHDVRIGTLRSGPDTSTAADDYREQVFLWSGMVGYLPRFETIKTITIDATPAPGWLRHDKPLWIPNVVNDRAVSSRFIYEHVAVIADLMAATVGFYNSIDHDVSIELAGLYGQRSRSFPNYIQRRCAREHLHISFTGHFVPEPSRRGPPMTIERGISELYSTRSIPVDRYRQQAPQIANAKRRLLEHTYTPTSEFLFQNCFEEDEYWTMSQLERLTDFTLDSDKQRRYIDVQIPDFARGSFICSLAKDLDLRTSPRSSWQKKELRVYRKRPRRKPTPITRGGFSVADFLITGVAMVAFVAIVRYQDRMERGRS